MTSLPRADSRRRWATAAMIGVVVYVVVDVVLQGLPPHYSPIVDAESNLAVGPYGWIMNLNFIGRMLTTVCIVAAIVQVRPASALRRVGVALLLLGGLCSGVLAFFPTDVGMPGEIGVVATTVAGIVHLAVAVTGFVAALLSCLVLTVWVQRSPELRAGYRPALIFAIIGGAGLLALGMAILVAPQFIGLAERICLLGILGWVFSVAAAVRSAPANQAIASHRPARA